MSVQTEPNATFFTEHQRATIEAAMARIIPTNDTPVPGRRARSTSSTAICRGSATSTPSPTAAGSKSSPAAAPTLGDNGSR